MGVLRILVWTANLAGAALLWSAAASEPPNGHRQLALALVASVMALTLAYVWMLEATRRRPGGKGRGLGP